MRKKLIVIFLFLLFPFFVSAHTKEEIINLVEVESQKMCDAETEVLYNRYFKLYSRLLKAKDVDQTSIDTIYKNLTTALNIVKKENLCSVEDLDRISSSQKSQLYNYFYESSKLIIKSPDLGNTETTVKYNSDKSIEIYENGEYLDRVTLSRTTFNYVGFQTFFVYLKYLLPLSLVAVFIAIFIFKKRKLLSNIFIIGFALLLVGNIFYFKFGSLSYDIYNLLKSMSYKGNTSIVKMEVNNKKIIKYPSHESEFAKLKIKDLNINLPIYYGDSKAVLKKGIGFTGSFPGFKGTVILSGHNSKLYLNSLKNITVGTNIEIETNYGKFKYVLSKIDILDADKYSSLEKNDKTLILYTCYPFDEIVYSNKRYVLYANLVEEAWSK